MRSCRIDRRNDKAATRRGLFHGREAARPARRRAVRVGARVASHRRHGAPCWWRGRCPTRARAAGAGGGRRALGGGRGRLGLAGRGAALEAAMHQPGADSASRAKADRTTKVSWALSSNGGHRPVCTGRPRPVFRAIAAARGFPTRRDAPTGARGAAVASTTGARMHRGGRRRLDHVLDRLDDELRIRLLDAMVGVDDDLAAFG